MVVGAAGRQGPQPPTSSRQRRSGKHGQVERLTKLQTGGPVFVDVEDGRIVRLTPIELGEDDKGDWTIEARGHAFTSPPQDHFSPHAQAQRSMIYSPKRILTPLSASTSILTESAHPHRGVSGYEPISWDQALDNRHRRDDPHQA